VIFQRPSVFYRLLHNDTSLAIQRRIRHAGLTMVTLPMLVHELRRNAAASATSVAV